MRWLEREACFVRRGSNNRDAKIAPFEQWGTRRLHAAGFIAAGFNHRTSRAGDPQLHTHVLVANLAKGPDGRWSALDGQALYRSKIAAGTVFQTALRNELSRRLGVEWLPVTRRCRRHRRDPSQGVEALLETPQRDRDRTRTHRTQPVPPQPPTRPSRPAPPSSTSTKTPSMRPGATTAQPSTTAATTSTNSSPTHDRYRPPTVLRPGQHGRDPPVHPQAFA